jgi:hypothetical protein
LFEKVMNFAVPHIFLEKALNLAVSINRFLERALNLAASRNPFLEDAKSRITSKDRGIYTGG